MANTDSRHSPQRVTYTVDGNLRLVGDAWGVPDTPPVLLLHGGGQTRHAWGGTAQTLAAQGWYAVALDLRGHGESDWSPDGNYMIDVFVRDIRQVIRHFRQTPVLVGASLGGMTSLLVEGESPRPVSSAVVRAHGRWRPERYIQPGRYRFPLWCESAWAGELNRTMRE
jgi:pimeloyl-ACP methyl ester carboxylesterase